MAKKDYFYDFNTVIYGVISCSEQAKWFWAQLQTIFNATVNYFYSFHETHLEMQDTWLGGSIY